MSMTSGRGFHPDGEIRSSIISKRRSSSGDGVICSGDTTPITTDSEQIILVGGNQDQGRKNDSVE
ncbi:hypothetical protein M6B38_396650 [Iris pallida]|uniref:Uncharacterized protein n=1 Tax=Iris pallida TaxID=29817 RepID=A0AAX6FW75_IRIPA|nr:hypothetical protein M6B38_396650 [Iris pallida]